jgi:hypothetical protein
MGLADTIRYRLWDMGNAWRCRTCRTVGHRREHYQGRSHWNRRRNRLEPRWYCRCRRCGCGEPDVWRYGWFEAWPIRVRNALWNLRERWRHREPEQIASDDDCPF